jgi:glycosyltransferase involved in cell wall biosynthesis
MPHGPEDMKAEFVKLLVAAHMKNYKIRIKKVPTLLRPYISEQEYAQTYEKYAEHMKKRNYNGVLYGKNIYEEVYRFSKMAHMIALSEEFDIIHCHDWMTFPAGIEAKKASGKPLVVQVHATEFDRTGGNSINQYVYEIEKKGMQYADKIIAVSYFTKQKIVDHYGINPDKIEVVHNAVDFHTTNHFDIKKHEKVVLFVGRLTLQKGPDYFVEAAKKVLDYDPNVKFIIAGTGDMEGKLIDRVAQLGIGHKVLFAGFISGPDVDRAYQSADVYVMPSVSEPFGITPLEALKNNVPAIISKQSGISEVLKHALKVDFWDVDELANKIISVLNYRAMHHELKHHGSMEVKTFTWNVPAEKCVNIYRNVLARLGVGA